MGTLEERLKAVEDNYQSIVKANRRVADVLELIHENQKDMITLYKHISSRLDEMDEKIAHLEDYSSIERIKLNRLEEDLKEIKSILW